MARLMILLLALLAGCVSVSPGPDDWRRPLQTLSGENVDWETAVVRGKRNVLVVMTAWCQACYDEQPKVEAYAEAHRDTRIAYIVAGSEPERAAEIVAERKIVLPVYADPDGTFSDHHGVRVTPSVLVFDTHGQLVGRYDSIEALPPESESALPRKLEAVVDSGSEIGTSYDVVVMASDVEKAREDLAAARRVVFDAESHLSEWKYDTDLSRLNREGGNGPVDVPADLLKLITASIKVSEATGGVFDITWLPLGSIWKQAAAEGRLPTEEALKTVLAAVGSDNIVIDGSTVSFKNPLTQVGLGAVAKGWIVDAVFLHLKKAGYENLIVNIGGDLRTGGEGPDGPWTFQIMDPYEPSRVAGTFELRDGAVATSGNYLRYLEIDGKRYGHILDPRTGWPPEFDGSVSAFASDCAMADALATALFVMGPEEGLMWVKANPGVDAIYATRQGLLSSIQ
jgi:FAD:protein FMN transferase